MYAPLKFQIVFRKGGSLPLGPLSQANQFHCHMRDLNMQFTVWEPFTGI